MPTYNVTGPDGQKYRVTAPEGATQEEIIAYAQQNVPAPKVDKYEKQAKEDSFGQNTMAAVGGVMSGIPLALRAMAGKTAPDEVKEWKQSMAGLWSTPGGKLGTIGGGVITAVPAMFVPGANTAVGAGLVGAGLGALQPEDDWQSRIKNVGIGTVLGGGTQAGLNKVGQMLANRSAAKGAELAERQGRNAARDSTVKTAQEAGYVIPPTQVSPEAPGLVNRLAEGFSGKAATAQAAAIKNEKVTLALAKRDLGIPDGVPLNRDTLDGVRKVAGQVYETVKKVGTIRPDKSFADELAGATAPYREVVSDFPSMANKEIDGLLQDLSKPAFNSSSLVELVKRLRADGRANLKAFDKPEKVQLGRVQMQAQESIEDLIERNLSAQGVDGLVDMYRNARVAIAKTHTVEDALEESTGKVVASKIGRKFSSGKPLSGGLETIGRTAEAFPKALQNVNSSMPGLSPLDYLAGGMAGASIGAPGVIAAGARPLVRAGLLSGPYQKGLGADYTQGRLGKVLPKLLEEEYLGLLAASQMPALTGRP